MCFRARTDRLLFSTHEPPFRARQWVVGQVLEHEGKLYRVTKWVELQPVTLERGGSVGEWQVWGSRISAREIRREIVSAAEAILDDESAREE